jgi:hypothetical protein
MFSPFNLAFFQIFHIFSLFNLAFFHIFHIISLFNLLFFHIFQIISLFNLSLQCFLVIRNKYFCTNCHDITVILLNVALNTNNLTLYLQRHIPTYLSIYIFMRIIDFIQFLLVIFLS